MSDNIGGAIGMMIGEPQVPGYRLIIRTKHGVTRIPFNMPDGGQVIGIEKIQLDGSVEIAMSEQDTP